MKKETPSYRIYYPDGSQETKELSGKLTLEPMQKIVGGDIELVRCTDKDYILIVNEMGAIKGMPENANASEWSLYPHTLRGTCILVREKWVD